MERLTEFRYSFALLAAVVAGFVATPHSLAQSGARAVSIIALPGDRFAAEHLREALRIGANRGSQIIIIDGSPDRFDTVRLSGALLKRGELSVAIVRWTRSIDVPSSLLWGAERVVTLGPATSAKVHLVSRRPHSLVVSNDPADRRSLENRIFGMGWIGTPTMEDGLNVFKAIEAYPCPANSKCRSLPFVDQPKMLLANDIHAYFLTAPCPDSQVESLQELLKANLFLVRIPHGVVRRMETQTGKPYLLDRLDPRECRYPIHQGSVETAGVAGQVVAPSAVAAELARDIARALIAVPPFPLDQFGSVLPKLGRMFPYHETSKVLFKDWLRQ